MAGADSLQAIIFDIGGVFLFPAARRPDWIPPERWQKAAKDAVGWDRDAVWDAYKRGGVTEESYWRDRVERLPSGTVPRWEALRDWVEACVRVDPDIAALARSLKGRIRLTALSNAAAELERRLRACGLSDLFETVVNSHRVGMAKPDPAIFEHTAGLMDLAAPACLLVDDKVDNVEAAHALGFQIHHYRTAAALARDLRNRFGIRV